MTTSENRSKYFARAVVYAKRDGDVVLVDMHDASASAPLEPWLGRVLLLADGSHTVQQLIDLLRKQYPTGAPRSLEATIDSVIERLAEGKAIVLSHEPVTLPYYLSLPANELDSERANHLMVEDGFQQGTLPK